MEREAVIQDLNKQIEALARLHIHHGLYHSEGFKRQRRHVENMVREHKVNVRKELDPDVNLLYKRYFDWTDTVVSQIGIGGLHARYYVNRPFNGY